MQICRTEELFDLSHTLAAPLFEGKEWPWQVLDELKDFILKLGESLPAGEYDQPQPGVWVAKSAKVAPTALLGAPCIIGPEAEVRHCAFIRGSAIVGKNAVVGGAFGPDDKRSISVTSKGAVVEANTVLKPGDML